MDELTFLCAQELLEDLSNTASSSDDEDEEREQKIHALKLLCAQNLMGDLLDSTSSSSSDEDDEFFAILGYTHLLERTENLGKCKEDNSKVPIKSNLKIQVKKSLLENGKDNLIATVLKKSTSKTKAECEIQSGLHDNSLLKETENVTTFDNNSNKMKIIENALNPLTECDFKRKKDKEDPILSFCNLQTALDDNTIDSLTENEFKQYFHINRDSFNYLMDRLSSWYCKSSHEQSAQKPNIKTTLLTFLGFCANPISFENAARMFKVPLMTSKESLNNMLDFFEKELSSEILKLPTSYIEKEAIAKDFEKIAGFPNVLGCLAVSYFSLKIPELAQICEGTQLYLRGICDSKRKFSNIKIILSKESTNDTFLENDLPKLCFPKYHLLSDATYPIRDHLVIPYENNENLSKSEEFFNTKHCRTHIKIKEAFGNLRHRFRQLQYLDFNSIETLTKFITTCCILHNICIDRQDFYDATYTDESCGQFASSSCSAVQTDDFLKDLGLMKRDELTQIFFRMKK